MLWIPAGYFRDLEFLGIMEDLQVLHLLDKAKGLELGYMYCPGTKFHNALV